MTVPKPFAILALAGALAGLSSGTFTAAQTPATPAKPAVSKPAVSKSATGAKTAVTPRSSVGPKLPPGVPPVRGLVRSAFALRYQEIKLGTGTLAESGKLYKVQYTGWLASDGKKFDSSYDHPGGQPFSFPQGRGRVIPGWDQGFEGMKIGGKRRLFIPYQLAYGATGRPPVIPAKADLIFDIELVSVDEMPVGGPNGGRPMPGGMRTPPAGLSAPGKPTPAPGSTPASPASPQAPAKPADPTAPTAVPPPPPQVPPTAPADKPANPAQPN
jgi:peptidylprolyl isomerase